jgi:flagellar biosynthetic protein FliR
MPDFTAWMVVFVRVTALLAIFPIFSTGHVPVMLRIGFGALVSLLLSWFVPVGSLVNAGFADLLTLLFSEASVGLLLGFICRFTFYAVELAGSIIANEIGLSMSFAFSPGTQGMLSLPGNLLHWLAVVLFFSLDLHQWMLWGIKQSYTILAPGAAGVNSALAENVLAASGQVFVIALQIAAPVLALSFVITLVFAFLGRIIPQMNVFAESFPVRVLTGLVIFGSTCSVMAQHIINYLKRMPFDFNRTLQLLALS